VKSWPNPNDIAGIDSHQREQLALATTSRIGILGGSPGTGKTYTVAKLVRHLLDNGLIALEDIGIGAPTGKAAVRLTEMLQSNGIDVRARTEHSMLEIGEHSETGQWTFLRNEKNPLPYRLIVIDETSMNDLSIMLSIFRARAPGCFALMVGDVNQLPPVGNGAPLRDMIAAGLPYGELREIKRNSGGIVEACGLIRDCLPWVDLTEAPGSNLRITHDTTPTEKQARILELLNQARRDGYDQVWDCQVLVAVNESSPLSRQAMNKLLQDALNPNEKSPGTEFRVADKIVCLKNGFYKLIEGNRETRKRSFVVDDFKETFPSWYSNKRYAAYLRSPEWKAKSNKIKNERGRKCEVCKEFEGVAVLQVHHTTYERIEKELDSDLQCLCSKCHAKIHKEKSRIESEEYESDDVYVANGELAEVIKITDFEVVAKLGSPARVVSIPIKKSNTDATDEADDEPAKQTGTKSNWDLGYALSVHKSQGSEWPVVIVALDGYAGAKMICDRAWLYTAISRGKQVVHLVGPAELAERFCVTQKIAERKTFLADRIKTEIFKTEIEYL
jgi:ATP-dependent exoDNAse (exonuclease V) alpha subunit